MRLRGIKCDAALRSFFITVLVACLFANTARAEDAERTAAQQLADGNRLLAERQYDEALVAYDKAAEALPRSAEVAYNRGVALYRLGRFAEAQTAFQDVLTRGRPALETRAKFNLGRSAQAAAMTKADNLDAAVNDLGRAIGFYKDTLQLRPDHVAAKKNMADAERLRGLLKKIMEMQPKQEQKKDGEKKDKSDAESQPDKDGEKQDSQQQGDKNDDQQQDDGDQDDEEQDASSDSEDDAASQPAPQREPSTQQASQPAEEPKTQPASQPATAPTSQPPRPLTTQPATKQNARDIERQEAEKMLQGARDAERKRRAEKRRRMMSRQGRIPVDKDW